MPRVLLLAATTGYQTRAFGDAAGRLGLELVFATDRCDRLDDPWQDRAIPIRFHDEDRSVAAILNAAAAAPIDGVVVVGDRPTVIAARVQDALGLPGHPPEAVATAGNKLRTRERLGAAAIPGLIVPWFTPMAMDANPRTLAASVRYPSVVKPLALSGSRGVMRANAPDEFVAAFERLRALLMSPDVIAERNVAHRQALAEAFIEGREYALEGVLHRGALHVLALFDKPDPLDGPFFEETIYLTPSVASPRVQAAIAAKVARAARAIGLWHGPVHAECRVPAVQTSASDDPEVFVLEVAARPIGGLCARALRFTRDDAGSEGRRAEGHRGDRSGLAPLEELLLRHALGEPLTPWVREASASGVMMIPIPRRGVFRGVDEVDAARAVPGIEDIRVTAKLDQVLVPLPEGASYLGFIFATGKTPADVEAALRRAHATLVCRIDPELPVVKRG